MAKSMLCLVQNSKLNENGGKDQLKNRNPVKRLRKMPRRPQLKKV